MKDVSNILVYNEVGYHCSLNDMIDEYLRVYNNKHDNFMFETSYHKFKDIIAVIIYVRIKGGSYLDMIKIAHPNELDKLQPTCEDFMNFIKKKNRLFVIDKILNT